MTLEELAAGIARRSSPALVGWLDGFVARHCDVLDVTAPIARLAGTLRGQLAARRRARPQADLLVVATAAHHGLVLVTRKVRELGGLGVSLLNPFSLGTPIGPARVAPRATRTQGGGPPRGRAPGGGRAAKPLSGPGTKLATAP